MQLMQVLKNLLMGLLAGDLALWALVVIVALIAWVVADAAILGRGVLSRHTSDDDRAWDRSEGITINRNSMFGGLWGNGCDKDGTPRL